MEKVLQCSTRVFLSTFELFTTLFTVSDKYERKRSKKQLNFHGYCISFEKFFYDYECCG